MPAFREARRGLVLCAAAAFVLVADATDALAEDPRLVPVVERGGWDDQYAGQNKDERFQIRPDSKQLLAAWKEGGSIVGYGFHGGSPTLLRLTFRLRNTLPANLVISGAYLEIDESMIDRQPLLQLAYEGPAGIGPGLGTRFSLSNQGWGNPLGGRLEFAFVKPSDTDPAARWATAATLVQIPESMSKPWALDIEDALARLGTDVKRLRRWSSERCIGGVVKGVECRGGSDQTCLGELQRNGVLGTLSGAAGIDEGRLRTAMVGRVTYQWTNADGVRQSYAGTFRQIVSLGFRTQECTPPAVVSPPPPEYDPATRIPVDLQLDKRKYRIDLPVSGTIPASGQLASRLLVRSAKSSQSRFRLVVNANGMTLRSPDIDLLAFVPRD